MREPFVHSDPVAFAKRVGVREHLRLLGTQVRSECLGIASAAGVKALVARLGPTAAQMPSQVRTQFSRCGFNFLMLLYQSLDRLPELGFALQEVAEHQVLAGVMKPVCVVAEIVDNAGDDGVVGNTLGLVTCTPNLVKHRVPEVSRYCGVQFLGH